MEGNISVYDMMGACTAVHCCIFVVVKKREGGRERGVRVEDR